jgi:mannose-6-phosphate isomerase-like protein (cupin superfamily)
MTAKHPRDMSADEREAFHRDAEAAIKTFRYEKPAPNGRPKQIAWFVRRPMMEVLVQVVKEGGENNLHYHTNSETTWMVLKGRARFIGCGDALLAELGPMEGILLPGGSRYRFSKIGDDDLEILQMVAVRGSGDGAAERINIETHKEWMVSPELTKYET